MNWYNDLDVLAVDPEPCEVQTSLKELAPTEDGGAVLMLRRWEADGVEKQPSRVSP